MRWSSQAELTLPMRNILTDWMIELSHQHTVRHRALGRVI